MAFSIVRVYRNYFCVYSASWEKLAFACPERLDPATSIVGQRKMNCWKPCVSLVSTLRVFVRDLRLGHVSAMCEDHTESHRITVSSRPCIFTWILLMSLCNRKDLATHKTRTSNLCQFATPFWWPGRSLAPGLRAICQMETCWKSTYNLCAPATALTFSGTHVSFKTTLSPQPNLQYL